MQIAFWFVVFAAFFHLLWEGVIAPAVRVWIRFKLFAKRDQIRREKLEANGSLAGTLQNTERFLNGAIYLVHHFGLLEFLWARHEVKCKARRIDIRESDVKEIADILWYAIAVNSIPFIVYCLPLAFGLRGLRSIATLLASKGEAPLSEMFPRSYAS